MNKILLIFSLFTCIFFSPIQTIEECSQAVRFFKSYQCLKDEPFGEGSAGKAFIVLKNQTQFILKHQKESKRSEAELKFLDRVKGLEYVIQLQEVAKNKNDVYVIINFGQKGSLLDMVIDGELSEDLIAIMKMFRKIVQGVVSIHRRNIVHADLKLDNIVVDSDNDPYIIDFDLAVEMNSQERGRGSLKYTSPEVLDAMYTHKNVLFDDKIDVYSLGIILYAMITQGFAFDIEPGFENLSYTLKRLPIVFEEGFNRRIMEIILSCVQERKYRIGSEQLLEDVTKFLLKPSSQNLRKEETYTINELTSLKMMEINTSNVDPVHSKPSIQLKGHDEAERMFSRIVSNFWGLGVFFWVLSMIRL